MLGVQPHRPASTGSVCEASETAARSGAGVDVLLRVRARGPARARACVRVLT